MINLQSGLLIFDCEIKHGVITPDNPAQPGYRYADGWQDFAGMGVSTCCAFDNWEERYRVFCDDNLSDFEQVARERFAIVGWNNSRFDNPLLVANGIDLDGVRSIDFAKIFWKACGINTDNGDHPKGLGLDATCQANGIRGKSGVAKLAPQAWQDGRIGQVIDYCCGDVRCLVQLINEALMSGGLIDPRNSQFVPLELNRVFE